MSQNPSRDACVYDTRYVLKVELILAHYYNKQKDKIETPLFYDGSCPASILINTNPNLNTDW